MNEQEKESIARQIDRLITELINLSAEKQPLVEAIKTINKKIETIITKKWDLEAQIILAEKKERSTKKIFPYGLSKSQYECFQLALEQAREEERNLSQKKLKPLITK